MSWQMGASRRNAGQTASGIGWLVILSLLKAVAWLAVLALLLFEGIRFLLMVLH